MPVTIHNILTRVAVSVASIGFAATPGLAQSHAPDIVEGAIASGEKEIALGVLASHRNNPDALATELRLMAGAGYIAGANASTYTRVTPFLRYDRNINGGAPNDEIAAGPFVFTIDEEAVAKEGMVVGGVLSAGIRGNAAPRLAYNGDALLEVGYSPQHDLFTARGILHGCLSGRLTMTTFADLCLTGQHEEKDLGSSSSLVSSAEISQVLDLDRVAVRAGVEIGNVQRWYDGRDRNSQVFAGLSADIVTGAWGSFGVAARLYEKIDEAHLPVSRLSASVAFTVQDRPVRASVFRETSRGGYILGAERGSVDHGASVTIGLTEKLGINLSYTDTNAENAFYDERDLSMGFEMSF